jgi:putative RNA 2'-phosphotransferase
MTPRLTEASKFLSYVLRHEPHAIGLALDTEGWAEIDALIAGARQSGHTLDLELIHAVVTSNDKKRFALSGDGRRIRAMQGHSTNAVTIQHKLEQPPEFLYHGTAMRFLDSIFAEGLRSGQRHHVHLSEDVSIATAVGGRYGKPVVLKIEALRMQRQGFVFFRADNGVWLTGHVPPAFIYA